MKSMSITAIGAIALISLVLSACAPGDLERLPLPAGEGSPAGVPGPGESAGLEGYPGLDVQTGTYQSPGAGLEIRPTEPICPTPTPDAGVTEIADEGEVVVSEEAGQTIVGPGETVTGYPDSETRDQILDKVNQGPGIPAGGEPGGTGSTTGPEPGTETLPPEENGSSQPPASGFAGFLNGLFQSLIGTPETTSGGFEPRPSPTPCP